jgi:hypothetical protein
MAITDAQKVDLLYKKVGFGVTKTDTSTNKSPANESISSPLMIRGDGLYSQSASITNVSLLPTSNVIVNNTSVVSIYRDSLSSAVQLVNDATAAANRTWKTNLTDWIGPEFGAGYAVKVYTGASLTAATAATGTSLPIDGSGNNDGWYFDYQAGILNFADTNVPTTLSTQVWIVGARYTGAKGISTLPSLAVTGNLTSTTGNIVLTSGNVYANAFFGTFSGVISGGIDNANVASYSTVTPVSTSPNTFYLDMSNIAVAGNSITAVSTNLSFVPSTGTLSASVFNGTGAFTTATATALNSTNGNITNFSSGNINFTNITNGTVSTANVGLFQQLSTTNSNANLLISLHDKTSGNAITYTSGNITFNPFTNSLSAGTIITNGGIIGGVGNVSTLGTLYVTNLSTGNTVISGGYVSALSNITATTGNLASVYVGTLNSTAGNITTLQATNFSTANARITGGYADNYPIGANAAATGAFTTLAASGITQISNATAATALNTGALQVAGGASVMKDSWFGANVTIFGNLDVRGNSVSIGSATLSVQDPIINLHSPADLTPFTTNDGFDIGIKVHYYDTIDSAGFFGRNNSTGFFEWYSRGTDVANVFVPTAFGTIRTGATILANARTVGGGLTANTGTLQVYGDGSISGNLFVGGNLVPGNVVASMTTGSVMGNVGNFNNIYGTFFGTVANMVNMANVSVYDSVSAFTTNQIFYPTFSNIATTGNTATGVNSALTYNPGTGTLSSTIFTGSGAFTTAQATNFSSGNVVVTGGYINNLANISAVTGTIATINGTAGNITNLFTAGFNTANAVITGGYINSLANLTVANAQATNFSTGNAVISGGYISALTNATITTASVTNFAATTAQATNFSTGNAVITAGYINNLANLTVTTAQATNLSSGNIYATGSTAGTWSTANVSLYETVTAFNTNQTFYVQFGNLSTTGNTTTGVNSGLTYNPGTGVLSAATFSGAISSTNSNFTNLQATNFSTANAVITGGYINNLANITAVTGTLGTINATAGNITTLQVTNFSTGNAVISGGYISALTNATITTASTTNLAATTATATNLASSNVAITGGYINNLANVTTTVGVITNLAATTETASNFASGNVAITGGYINNLANVTAAAATIAVVNATTGNITTLQATNFSTGNAVISGGYISSLANMYATTATVTNLSSGNAVITGGYINNLANLSATTATATNFSSGNAVIAGGYINNLANLSATTATATNFSSGNMYATGSTTGTWATANVSLSQQLTTNSTSATFYPAFYNALSGNAIAYTGTGLTYNPGQNTLTAGTFSGIGSFSTMITSGVTTHQANVVINNGSNTNNNTTGALVITGTGGIAVAGNINIGSQMFVGSGSQATVLTSPVAVKRGTSTSGAGTQYTQDALINGTNTGSSDFIAYGNNYAGPSSDHGWADIGYTGDAFNDPVYSITKANDGYMFASGANTTVGGNLVLSTDWSGSYNDIVIGVGSFYANSEVARFHGNTSTAGTFTIKLPTATTTANTGALQVWGGASFGANTYHGGATIFNGSQTAGNDFIVKGKSDATLIWARPGSSYDQVVVGNSATTSTLVTGAKLIVNSTDAMIVPSGTTAQRPSNTGGTDTAGMIRYNNTSNSLEFYNGTSWQSTGSSFTVITDVQFNGDGGTTAFSNAGFASTTTSGLIVSINGVVQIPTLAYSLTGTTINFTEAPSTGDVIDVRVITTSSTVTAIASTNGFMGVSADNNGVYINTGTSSATVYNWFNTTGAFVSNVANVSVATANTPTTIDTIDNTQYRSAKYIIQATNGTNYQVAEALVISNGTTATISVYGVVQTAGNLGIVSATQSGSNTLIQFVAANNNNNIRVSKQYIMI